MCKLTALRNNLISSTASEMWLDDLMRGFSRSMDRIYTKADVFHFPEWTLGQTTLKEEAALFTSSSSTLFCSCLSSSLLVNLANQKKKTKSLNLNSNHGKADTQKALHCTTLPFHLIRVVFGRRTRLVGGGRLCTGHWGWFQLIFCHEKENHRGIKRRWL